MPQIPCTPSELQHIGNRIQIDYSSAQNEHDTRMRRWDMAYRALMSLLDAVSPENRKKSNMQVPLMMWSLFDHIAGEHQSIFGADAHIEAEPIGDADAKTAEVVGAGMQYLVYKAMKLKKKWARFSFYRAFFGRAFAYRPYCKKTYKVGVMDPETGELLGTKDVVYEDCPGFEPQWPDDVVVPAEDVVSHDEFSFMIHRQFLTLEETQEGERSGKFFGITENIEQIAGASKQRSLRSQGGQEMKNSRDQAEGVTPNAAQEKSGRIEVWSWYSHWKFPKKGPEGEDMDVGLYDREGRDDEATEVVCSYIPDLALMISVENLVAKYPEMQHRRPFWSSALNESLSYWGPGYAHMLFGLQAEATDTHKLFKEAGSRNAMATIFMRPLAAAKADGSIELEPGRAYYTQDPASVQAIKMGGDASWCNENDMKIFSMAEKLTGNPDPNGSRMVGRPSEPKLATQIIALQEAGNIRTSFNSANLNEDLTVLLGDCWKMWAYFGGERLIFRITEKDLPPALFAKVADLNEIEQTARAMDFDFKLRFAPSEFRRAAQRQDALQLLQVDMTNPIVMQQPRALYNITRKVHELFGDRDFGTLVPAPPELDIPTNPVEEWVRMQQGEEIMVNPIDPDEVHIEDHTKRVLQEAQAPDPDQNLLAKAQEHIVRHQKQLAMKRMMQAAMQGAGQVLGGMQQQGMGQPQQGQPQQNPMAAMMGGPQQ